MANRVLLTHLLFLTAFSFGIVYDMYYLKVPNEIRHRLEAAAGRWKFLTIWNVIILATFYALSVLNDIFGTVSVNPQKRGKLQKLLDSLFCTIAFPTSLIVTVSFWGLYHFDRNLIFPPIFDTFFPSWLNHLLHSVVCFAVFSEAIFVPHFYPKRIYGVLGICTFLLIYLAWTYIIVYVWGFWTYPILEVLNFWQKILFYGAFGVIIIIFYLLGEFISTIRFGKLNKKTNAGRKKKSN